MERREFLLSAAAAAGALAARRREAYGAKVLRAGLVGCGWYGMVDLRHLIALGQVKVVGLCDPDKNQLDGAAKEVTELQKEKPDTFSDFRQMLKPDSHDVVLVGSPDHWHALHAIAAMNAGADVYCQKPISHTFLEGEAMVKTARKLGRVVQVGTQRRSTPHIVQARELVRSGALGKIGLVRAHCHVRMRGNDNPPDVPPPAHLDFDLWTGPAPLRPYSPILHPKRWRCFEEYSNGILGDMGIHMLDLGRWFLDLRWPKVISSTGGIFVERAGKANVPDTQSVQYDYGDVTVVWEHRTWGRQDYPDDVWGISFFGEKGILRVNLDRFEFAPLDKNAKHVRVEAVREPDPTKLEGDHVRPAGRAHMKDLLDAIAKRSRPVADIEEGHLSTALCELGNLSQKLGRPVAWDAGRERPAGDPAATKLLSRAYRKGWVYPKVPGVA
jgi:predicted dehydrogenase